MRNKGIVIDADNNRIIREFNRAKTEEVKAIYENDGRWGCVSVDRAGDIILWEE